MMTTTCYDVNGIRLHVWEEGPAQGQPILLLHGFPEAGFAWEKVMHLLAARGFRVMAPDQRGYNLSSKPKGVKAYRIGQLAADMVALLRAAGYTQVMVVGHDWGGGVAWHLALHHPEVVYKLVILNMPHPEVLRQTLRHNGRQRKKSSYAAFFQVPLIPEWLAARHNFRMLEQALTRTSLRGTFAPELLERYRAAWRQPQALTAMINWYRAYAFTQPRSTAPITLPVIILWGRKDAFLLAEMAAGSAALCTNVRLELLDNATHWLHHEHPAWVAEQIGSFAQEPA